MAESVVVNVVFQGKDVGSLRQQLATQLKDVPLTFKAQNLKAMEVPITVNDASLAKFHSELQARLSAMKPVSIDIQAPNTNAVSKSLDKTAQSTQKVTKATKDSSRELLTFTERIGLTIARLGAYNIAAQGFYRLFQGISFGVQTILEANKQTNRLTQILEGNSSRAREVSEEVANIARAYGLSATELLGMTVTLAQAGDKFSAIGGNIKNTSLVSTINALAKTQLAATFGSLADAGQGMIAILNQFNLTGRDTGYVLDVVNQLSKRFAFEAGDIFRAVRAGAGSFKIAGGQFEEYAALVTALRQTTRLSAEQIGTSFNTIALRLQRPKTIEYLEKLGIKLRDANGELLPITQQLLKIAEASESLSGDQRGQLIEVVSGIRQGAKLAPLLKALQRDGTGSLTLFEQTLSQIKRSAGSLDTDVKTGLEQLGVTLGKATASFEELFVKLSKDDGIRRLVENFSDLAQSIAGVLKVASPLLPILTQFALLKGVQGLFGALPRVRAGFHKAAHDYDYLNPAGLAAATVGDPSVHFALGHDRVLKASGITIDAQGRPRRGGKFVSKAVVQAVVAQQQKVAARTNIVRQSVTRPGSYVAPINIDAAEYNRQSQAISADYQYLFQKKAQARLRIAELRQTPVRDSREKRAAEYRRLRAEIRAADDLSKEIVAKNVKLLRTIQADLGTTGVPRNIAARDFSILIGSALQEERQQAAAAAARSSPLPQAIQSSSPGFIRSIAGRFARFAQEQIRRLISSQRSSFASARIRNVLGGIGSETVIDIADTGRWIGGGIASASRPIGRSINQLGGLAQTMPGQIARQAAATAARVNQSYIRQILRRMASETLGDISDTGRWIGGGIAGAGRQAGRFARAIPGRVGNFVAGQAGELALQLRSSTIVQQIANAGRFVRSTVGRIGGLARDITTILKADARVQQMLKDANDFGKGVSRATSIITASIRGGLNRLTSSFGGRVAAIEGPLYTVSPRHTGHIGPKGPSAGPAVSALRYRTLLTGYNISQKGMFGSKLDGSGGLFAKTAGLRSSQDMLNLERKYVSLAAANGDVNAQLRLAQIDQEYNAGQTRIQRLAKQAALKEQRSSVRGLLTGVGRAAVRFPARAISALGNYSDAIGLTAFGLARTVRTGLPENATPEQKKQFGELRNQLNARRAGWQQAGTTGVALVGASLLSGYANTIMSRPRAELVDDNTGLFTGGYEANIRRNQQNQMQGNVLSSAASFATTGAFIGGSFGPWGVLGGAVVGGLAGAIIGYFQSNSFSQELQSAEIGKAIGGSIINSLSSATSADRRLGDESSRLFQRIFVRGYQREIDDAIRDPGYAFTSRENIIRTEAMYRGVGTGFRARGRDEVLDTFEANRRSGGAIGAQSGVIEREITADFAKNPAKLSAFSRIFTQRTAEYVRGLKGVSQEEFIKSISSPDRAADLRRFIINKQASDEIQAIADTRFPGDPEGFIKARQQYGDRALRNAEATVDAYIKSLGDASDGQREFTERLASNAVKVGQAFGELSENLELFASRVSLITERLGNNLVRQAFGNQSYASAFDVATGKTPFYTPDLAALSTLLQMREDWVYNRSPGAGFFNITQDARRMIIDADSVLGTNIGMDSGMVASIAAERFIASGLRNNRDRLSNAINSYDLSDDTERTNMVSDIDQAIRFAAGKSINADAIEGAAAKEVADVLTGLVDSAAAGPQGELAKKLIRKRLAGLQLTSAEQIQEFAADPTKFLGKGTDSLSELIKKAFEQIILNSQKLAKQMEVEQEVRKQTFDIDKARVASGANYIQRQIDLGRVSENMLPALLGRESAALRQGLTPVDLLGSAQGVASLVQREESERAMLGMPTAQTFELRTRAELEYNKTLAIARLNQEKLALAASNLSQQFSILQNRVKDQVNSLSSFGSLPLSGMLQTGIARQALQSSFSFGDVRNVSDLLNRDDGFINQLISSNPALMSDAVEPLLKQLESDPAAILSNGLVAKDFAQLIRVLRGVAGNDLVGGVQGSRLSQVTALSKQLIPISEQMLELEREQLANMQKMLVALEIIAGLKERPAAAPAIPTTPVPIASSLGVSQPILATVETMQQTVRPETTDWMLKFTDRLNEIFNKPREILVKAEGNVDGTINIGNAAALGQEVIAKGVVITVLEKVAGELKSDSLGVRDAIMNAIGIMKDAAGKTKQN